METVKEESKLSGLSRTYLILYNTLLFKVFLFAYVTLLRLVWTETLNKQNLLDMAHMVKAATLTQYLEVVHPMLGIVPGGALRPFLQVSGRYIAAIFTVDQMTANDAAPFVKYLFLVWLMIEVVRYPFYALRLLNIDVPLLTWLRYTLFLPLMPLGAFCEGQVLLSAANQLEKTGAMSLSLPNEANFSFHMPTFLRYYSYLVLGPAIIFMMLHMCSQREKQLKSID